MKKRCLAVVFSFAFILTACAKDGDTFLPTVDKEAQREEDDRKELETEEK